MTIHLFIGIVVLWAVLAIVGIFAFAYLIGRMNDLGILTKARMEKLMDAVEKAREMQQAFMQEILETRIEVRKHSDSLVSMFELYAGFEEHMKEMKDTLQLQTAGEIMLPDMSEEFEDRIREECVENKDIVCMRLTALLQMTRAGEDIKAIRYEKVDDTDGFHCEEYAVIEWENGTKTAVLITADSGKAIVQDVLKAI